MWKAFSMRSRQGLGMLLTALLCGCGSVDVRHKSGETLAFETHLAVPVSVVRQLEDAPVCCTSLADLPYQDLAADGERRLEIGETGPAFAFPDGKSFFAAFRLSGLRRPAMIELASYRSAEPGSLGKLIPDLRQLVFAPQVLILDDKFQVRRTLRPGKPLADCAINPYMDVYRLHVDLAESSAEASYMVILTTGEFLKQDGLPVCGVVRHGLSPIGNLALRISSLDFKDGQARLRSSWKWYPEKNGAREIGLLSDLFQEPGLLVLGDHALHFFNGTGGRYAEALSIPYERMVSVKAGTPPAGASHQVVIGALAERGNDIVHHTFLSWPIQGEPVLAPGTVEDRLAGLVRPNMLVEKIGFSVAKLDPEVEFMSSGNTPMARLGKAAMTGGVATAFPCGLCQTGACTPDMLASCAALFSVGAVVGGVIGAGQEVLNAIGSSSPPDNSRAARDSITPLVKAARGRKFDQGALTKCLRQELDRLGPAAWHDQGRTGLPSVIPAPAAPALDSAARASHLKPLGYQYGAESFIAHIAMVPIQGVAASDDAVALRIAAEVRLSTASGSQAATTSITWTSKSHGLKAWSAPAAGLAEEVLQQACRDLANQIVAAGREYWLR